MNNIIIENLHKSGVREIGFSRIENMPLIINEQPPLPSKCGDCNLCVNACPAYAISGEEWSESSPANMIIDPRACSEYMKKNFQDIGRGAVCGLCIVNCRMNKNI